MRGDVVNTASRMESSGEVGQVNISDATFALVKDAVVAEDGGVSSQGVP
jgi:adenylate cyclase